MRVDFGSDLPTDTGDEVHRVQLAQQVPAGLKSRAWLGVQQCPERCISVEQ